MEQNANQDLSKATELKVDDIELQEEKQQEQSESEISEVNKETAEEEKQQEQPQEEKKDKDEVETEDNTESKQEITEEPQTEDDKSVDTEQEPTKEASDTDSDNNTSDDKDQDKESNTVEEQEVPNIDELNAKLAELEFEKKEAENIRAYQSKRNEIETNLMSHTDMLTRKLNEAFEHFGIDPNKTMDELKAEDMTKAAIAQGLIDSAIQKRDEAINQAKKVISEMEDNLIFDRVEKEVQKYKLTPDQMRATADTFIQIMNEVGIKDLGEDLKAKVKLAVAQAVMDTPRVEKPKEPEAPAEKPAKESVVKEEKTEVPTEDEKKPAEVEKPVVEEEKPAKPDLSEFKEGIDGGAVGADAVTEDNVLEKLAALPYRERTKFLSDNFDTYTRAMTKARANADEI
jgi:hypothetical protein